MVGTTHVNSNLGNEPTFSTYTTTLTLPPKCKRVIMCGADCNDHYHTDVSNISASTGTVTLTPTGNVAGSSCFTHTWRIDIVLSKDEISANEQNITVSYTIPSNYGSAGSVIYL